KEYEAPSKRFRVSMPEKPEFGRKNFVDSTKGEKRVYEMAISRTLSNTLYIVNVIHLIDRNRDVTDEFILRDLLSDMVKSKPDNKIVQLQTEPYLGYAAMQFKLENPETVMKGMAFVKDDIAYVLTVVGRPPFDEVNDFQYFVNSFQIIPE
ncbi:MAG: hypothetical protein KDK65_05890, partial [Chlamydiia bacterium]|nr:hypothetical protein [Chlamydiia bacterium]